MTALWSATRLARLASDFEFGSVLDSIEDADGWPGDARAKPRFQKL
jgi:hypothetical protein